MKTLWTVSFYLNVIAVSATLINYIVTGNTGQPLLFALNLVCMGIAYKELKLLG